MRIFLAIIAVASMAVSSYGQLRGPLVDRGPFQPTALDSAISTSHAGESRIKQLPHEGLGQWHPKRSDELHLKSVSAADEEAKDSPHRNLYEKCKKSCWKESRARKKGCVNVCLDEIIGDDKCKKKCKKVRFKGRFRKRPPKRARKQYCVKICQDRYFEVSFFQFMSVNEVHIFT